MGFNFIIFFDVTGFQTETAKCLKMYRLMTTNDHKKFFSSKLVWGTQNFMLIPNLLKWAQKGPGKK